MRRAWLLDVLADLRAYARDEGLDLLARQIDDTLIVARAEIARGEDGTDRPPPDLFAPPPAPGSRRH